MAILGEIFKENTDRINVRNGDVVGDVIIESDYLQLRTYALGDTDRERGSKQNIQFTREKAKEFRDLLDKFIHQ